MAEHINKVRTPWFPRYSEVRQLLSILEGVSRDEGDHIVGTLNAEEEDD